LLIFSLFHSTPLLARKMTLLMYSGPERKRSRELDRQETLRIDALEKKAKATKKWIHPNLRFEEIAKNKTPQVGCSPDSLSF